MENSVIIILLFFSCYQHTQQLIPLPDFIHPCSELNDECFTQATLDAIPGVVRGIPEAGIPPLDPLYLDKNITMALPGNVKMTFHNGKLLGLSTCVPSKVSSRREKRTFVFDIQCNFTIKGHYSIVGRILLFNLNTDGNAKIKIWNQKIHLEVLEKVVKNDKGEGHYKINSYKYKADYGTDLKLNLTNLFRGSPEISANILSVLNSNSQLVAQEFGGPILDYAIDYAMNVTQKFFDAYTYDQISHVPLTDDFFEED
ncbi:Circadian clock-controlled protein [Papilio machaon]|uniref:Circadian clock-controlled protein n=1 Tax=Papilio machaon TaxID=76193 RepID=A0A194RPF4_PAPMA|nr:protein takeout [Papilio machaon]KPJ17901.1 Circadian clock-controlled protein [Papilio machaon]